MQTQKFARKPFLIDAVQVTKENMEDVAKWCGGEIRTDVQKGRKVTYLYVPVTNARTERQKKAFIGEYVLQAGRSFKCYTKKAFDDCFEEPSDELLAELQGQARLPFERLAKHFSAPGQV